MERDPSIYFDDSTPPRLVGYTGNVVYFDTTTTAAATAGPEHKAIYFRRRRTRPGEGNDARIRLWTSGEGGRVVEPDVGPGATITIGAPTRPVHLAYPADGADNQITFTTTGDLAVTTPITTPMPPASVVFTLPSVTVAKIQLISVRIPAKVKVTTTGAVSYVQGGAKILVLSTGDPIFSWRWAPTKATIRVLTAALADFEIKRFPRPVDIPLAMKTGPVSMEAMKPPHDITWGHVTVGLHAQPAVLLHLTMLPRPTLGRATSKPPIDADLMEGALR